jgi:hypothetical protein
MKADADKIVMSSLMDMPHQELVAEGTSAQGDRDPH